MASESRRIPAGPVEAYSNTEDLLLWLGEQFERFGDIYKASIYGTDVYVLNAPEYIEHVLLKNWQNYPKGQAIKRIAFLLGNGLMVSKGDLWARQRRMIQPAFNRSRTRRTDGRDYVRKCHLAQQMGGCGTKEQRASMSLATSA